MKQRFTILYCLAFLCCTTSLFAQPANNECANAQPLTNLNNWCSAAAGFTNVGATLSNTINPGCFPSGNADVWFSFVAQANTVNIRVIGATGGNTPPGGSLEDPQFALYSGTCSALTPVQCASDAFDLNIAETFAGPLTIGETYYIRVDARNNNTGTFKLCINNYNAVPELSGDCPTGVILCDKSPFSVELAVGEGSDPNEVDGSTCINAEIACSWYRWTCKTAGTLSFTITPNNSTDDIDFAVYELPGGIGDCANKQIVRCEAAGENVGEPFANWQSCSGPTGLSLSETDLTEFPGCAPGQNNFVAALDMVVGKSYALVINNFSESGNGFSIEFGGTGTFLGPTADFTVAPQTICQGSTITFTDNSTSLDPITAWQWNFGIGASPATATGKGPHTVTYNTPGTKSVALTITNEEGCQVTDIETINVLPLPAVTPTLLDDYCGPMDNTGAVILSPSGNGQPYMYDWTGTGVFTSDSSLLNLASGNYSVVVQTASGCTQSFNFTVDEGLSLAAGVDPVTPPTCNGDSDGSISISIQIANPPVTFDFGNGPQSSNTLSGILAGTYNVLVVDGQGCEGDFTIEVVDFPPLLLSIAPLDISCFGANDGTITVTPTGGAGGYTYLWSNGATTSTVENLSAGTYAVTVTDENGCSATAQADIIEPAELTATLEAVDVICFGDETGVITVTATGGTPPFEYSSNGTDFQTDPALINLAGGNYDVVVRDSRGCTITLPATINQPPPIIVEAGNDQTIDLGYSANLIATVSPPTLPVTLSWVPSESLNCADCLRPEATPFLTTTYTLTATDENNCSGVDSVTVFVNLVRPVYIPNVFSPNGDGLNDFFTVFGGKAAKSIKALKVFDRWGDNVFEGFDLPLNDEPLGWDGVFRDKLMGTAVFAYLAQVEFVDGVVVLFEGDVMIIR
ncbi:MAG: gliding motility-associated C-terminal domain-containing protein [Saprospiraceae bacterium]|nr:gliding motility-associated C-terminal domain-containing protein [Saprospiraceae bacterium]MCF8252520.1 gliding motility-associated C-terminal domain-containing protein [Saprospiraceae bacterium]MCF8282544.1 gliding motility-associated C-terminal domain-containing protein [Bacteroidales bacterium]MCF8314129.1 gliding motility-associated C-terminal domain-containing protein [Saprospiraceae bacterium]MCF8442874.1 gliding motility-associated C-terminal domain-containing protein [Saprospiraceae 